MKFYKLIDSNPQSKNSRLPLGVIRCLGDKVEWFRYARWVDESELRDEVSLLIVEGSEFQEITLSEANDIIRLLSGL